MTNILPCKKCGWMPARFVTTAKEDVYKCINPDCGKPEDPALKKWNEANK